MTSKYLRIDGTDSAVKLYIDRTLRREENFGTTVTSLNADLVTRFGFNPSYTVDSTNSVNRNWVYYEIRNGLVNNYNL